MPVEDYVRNARVIRVVDGDTLDVEIDLGFSTWVRKRVRVLGVNCPEMTGESREDGKAAKRATQAWLANAGYTVTIKTHLDKIDSFGRALAEVWSGRESLASHLLSYGYAVPFRQRRVRQT